MVSADRDGISIREFAKRAGCDEKVVRRKVQTAHVIRLPNGKLDPNYLLVDWRRGERPSVLSADKSPVDADTQAPTSIAYFEGRKLWSIVEAERVKENYAARLKKLQYDQASIQVVEIDDVIEHVRAEYKIVRDAFVDLGAAVAAQIVVSRDPEQIHSLIDDEIHRRLTVLTTLVPA